MMMIMMMTTTMMDEANVDDDKTVILKKSMVVVAVVMMINFYLFHLLRKFTRKISFYWQEQYHWQLQAVWVANWLYTRERWYLDLLIWSDGTKHDFCEVLRGEHAETDSTNRLVVLNQS